MLARCVFTVWGAWLGALGLAAALTASRIWNANPIFGVGLPLQFSPSKILASAAEIDALPGT
jgi:hypothetical protein